MNKFLNDQNVPIKYLLIEREYAFVLNYSSSIQLLFYCPWCSSKLPEGLREEYHKILNNEYSVFPELDRKNDPAIPEEFKSDAWWKKRGL